VSTAIIVKDHADTLSQFRLRHDIPYLLLSDPASAVIKQYGIFNFSYEPGTKYHGVPWPGIFLVNSEGVIVRKFAEESYRDRPLIEDVIQAAMELSR
jgi:peroxiredoxin